MTIYCGFCGATSLLHRPGCEKPLQVMKGFKPMTKAEAQAHMDTLQEARTAAEKAVRRVIQEVGETGLLGPLNAINTAFENAIERIRMTRTED